MTPKEKAKELIDKYQFVYIQNYTSMFEVKECALIAVDEIIENEKIDNLEDNNLSYWQQVKQEIINI
jgi:hypothetical protein